ncbi:MAG: hypothetical protein QM539_02830 [Alphaproteobacteria bacterium]|nr:hypothetical protein [Alphaproteobacteria bacterium]
MSKLPQVLLNEFYAEKMIIHKPIVFEGNVTAKVLIITDYTHDKRQSTPTEIAFLDKILASCKLTRQDCIVVNNSFQKQAYKVILKQFNVDIVLFFTDYLIYDYGFSLDFKFYEPFEDQGVKIVVSETLDQLLLTTPKIINAKKRLWNALCQIFQITV